MDECTKSAVYYGTSSVTRSEINERESDADWFGARLENCTRLREHVRVDEENVRFATRDAACHQHRFSRSRRFIEHPGVGGTHSSQVADHRLERDESLESALSDFRLIGRVRRVPRRVFKDVPLDDTRHDGVVIAEPNHVAANVVLVGNRAKLGDRLAFARCSRDAGQE